MSMKRRFKKVELTNERTRNLEIALSPETEFADIVKYLEVTLTIPEIPGVRGCQPCLSGLDRLVIESQIFEQIG